MTNKEEQVELAKLAGYPDMMVAMKKVVESNSELTNEERELLSVGYSKVTGTYRSSWGMISDIEQKVEGSKFRPEIIKNYREKIENDLKHTCYEILSLLDKYLIPNATTTESKVIYLKMKGDYYRYLTVVATGNERQKLAEESKHAYNDGFEMAKNQMLVTHPVRLGIALNFSVLYYEILKETNVACQIAKQAFDDALAGLERLDGDAYSEATLIMQPLHDNLQFWIENQCDLSDADQPKGQQ